jgi:hypothetical protein
MVQLGKKISRRQAIAASAKLFISFPVKHQFTWRVRCFLKLKLALNPAGAYIPHSFYNE